jgi:hypothetical protein
LHVSGSIRTDVDLKTINQGKLNLGSNQGGGAVLVYNSNGNLDISPRSGFATTFLASDGGTECARIDSNGRLLVGTSSYDGNARAIIQGNTSSNTTGALVIRFNGTRPASDTGIGAIRFESTSNTSSNYHYASINCDTDGTSSSDTDIPGRLVFSTTADGAASPTERMRIDSSGRLGIGTTATAASCKLNVDTGINCNGLNVSGNGGFFNAANKVGIDNNGGISRFYSSGANSSTRGSYDFRITDSVGTLDTSAVIIDNSGRVGIGTTSPSLGLLEVSSTDGVTLAVKNTSPTVIGNEFCQLTFNSTSNSATNFESAKIKAISTNGGANLAHLTFENSGTERARIDSSGRLLVGTSSARTNFFNGVVSAALQLEGTGTNRRAAIIGDDFEGSLILASQKSGSVGGNTVLASGDPIGAVSFQGSDGTEFVEAATITALVDRTPGANDMPGRLVFSTTADGAASPTEQMRITSQGNVLIGSTVDSIGKFGVAADTNATPGNRVALFTSTYTGGDSAYESIGIVKNANDTTTSNTFQVFYVNGGVTVCGKITANGAGAAAFGSTSDSRLKENIVNLEPQLHNICALRPVEFDYIKSEGGGHQIGFIAQEIESVYPDAVSEQSNGMKVLTGWSKTEARLVKAFQEAIAKIETLEARLSALEGV